MMELHISTYVGILGSYSERYVPDGYYEPIDTKKQLEILSEIDGIEGIGVIYPDDWFPKDPDRLVDLLGDYNLKVADITVENYTNRIFKHGAYCTNEKNVREENIKLCKEVIDFAAAIPGTVVTMWPGHDGFDYPFQASYQDGWKNMVESFQELCQHNPQVNIAVEYKQKDPRQRFYVGNMGKAMMLINDVGMDNLKVAFDTGHSLMSLESLAESAILLDMHDSLGTIHLNDNYRDADPDLIFGALAFWDNLEMYYYLNKTDYCGWNEIDIVSPRDDRRKSLELTVKLTRKYKALADRLAAKSDVIDKNLKGYRFADNMNLITDLSF